MEPVVETVDTVPLESNVVSGVGTFCAKADEAAKIKTKTLLNVKTENRVERCVDMVLPLGSYTKKSECFTEGAVNQKCAACGKLSKSYNESCLHTMVNRDILPLQK